MGLFSKIFGPKPDPSAPSVAAPATSAKDNRNFERYVIGYPHFLVTFPNQTSAKMFDLSYGGFSVKAADVKLELEPNKLFNVTIQAVGLSFSGDVTLKHVNRGLCGFMFSNKSTDALGKMQRIIERVKGGATLKQVDPKLLNVTLNSNHKNVYRGEGPTDLTFQHDGERISSLSIYFRSRKDYWNIVWENGVMQSAVAEDQDIQGSKNFRKISPVPHETAIDAILIFAGIADQSLQMAIKPASDDFAKL